MARIWRARGHEQSLWLQRWPPDSDTVGLDAPTGLRILEDVELGPDYSG
jgi:hypothetical protein